MANTPAVVGEAGATPALDFSVADAAAPKGLVVDVLSEGTGPVVTAGRTIRVHYLGQIWNGNVFDSSFSRGAPASFPIGRGMVIQGWDRGLVGKNVGSRVLLSIPPEMGYGSRGMPQAGIGGTDTLVFVVDILDVR